MFANKLKLIFLTWVVYGTAIFIYTTTSYYQNFLLSEKYDFLIQKTLLVLLILYSIYILLAKKEIDIETEKVFYALTGFQKIFYSLFLKNSTRETSSGLNFEEKKYLSLIAVKFFFIPIMAIFSLENFNTVSSNIRYILQENLSAETIFIFYYPFILSVFIFIDTVYFLFGYLVESKKMRSEIISVESTALGWTVALICYPPFNTIPNDLLGWYSRDFNNFGNIHLNLFFGGLSLFLMFIYLWATLSLGPKASNLTNRGIISSGAYSIVRHPAYVAKNLTWWIMSIPFILIHIQSDNTNFATAIAPIASILAWSAIYYLRAVTEERHLLSTSNADYVKYMKKVKYMFIPKIL